MIAAESFLLDELVEVLVGAFVSQIPSIILYIASDPDRIKYMVESAISKIGVVL